MERDHKMWYNVLKVVLTLWKIRIYIVNHTFVTFFLSQLHNPSACVVGNPHGTCALEIGKSNNWHFDAVAGGFRDFVCFEVKGQRMTSLMSETNSVCDTPFAGREVRIKDDVLCSNCLKDDTRIKLIPVILHDNARRLEKERFSCDAYEGNGRIS